MVIEVVPAERARDRVLELIQKTNQFNLTTRRYNWSELSSAIGSGLALSYRLKDKFGDNGIISVVGVSKEKNADARIDLWLMSCRVFGRKVEHAILADIAERAREWGARRLIGEYIATPKNDIVRDLYVRLGFEQSDRKGNSVFFQLSLESGVRPAKPDFIRLIEAASVNA
jgi:FkbH-like protein